MVASDEDNVLRVYRRADGGSPEFELDLSKFLAVDPRQPESGIEAAARVGNRIYWITSHGRNRRGAARPSRQRFFATDLTGHPAEPLAPVGECCDRLVEPLLRDPRSQPGRSYLYRWNGRDRQAQRLDQPPFSGFNPEGLAFFAGANGWEFLVVSDDGTRSVAGQICKKLADPDRRMFRALTFPARLLDLP